MVDVMSNCLEQVSAPPLSGAEPPIDFGHLSRMTLGERRLEREVLALFDRQADLLIGRLGADDPGVVAAAAHILKGSAQSIGAWSVVRAADEIEAAAACQGDLAHGVAALKSSLHDLRLAIADLIRAH